MHHKRVARLLRTMGLETIYPKPRLRQPHPAHRVYPYLLRGVPITRVHQVWSTDMTSMRLHGGFIYLVAVMDWFSRYVLSWAVSITMDVGFCLEALDEALERARPEIFNTDQGAQFTSLDFTERLTAAGIQISMDGRAHIPHPSDGDPHIFPGACFARTAPPHRGMLSSHERRYAKHLRFRSVVWGSCYRPSKPTKSTICPL